MLETKILRKYELGIISSLFFLLLISYFINESRGVQLGAFTLGGIMLFCAISFNLTFYLLYKFKTEEGKDYIPLFYRFGLIVLFTMFVLLYHLA